MSRSPSALLSAFILALACAVRGDDVKITTVTYGSTIKLVHIPSGYRLHSHEIKYGSGSGQQSVTAYHSTGDANSYWLVRGPHDKPEKSAGTVVRCGDVLRLQHVSTSRNLHSHLHQAPLNGDYEVSAYSASEGPLAHGDTGDNWKLECGRGKSEWGRADEIKFQHVDTGYYLSSSKSLVFHEPISSQLQVSGSNRRRSNAAWKTDEGIFLAPRK